MKFKRVILVALASSIIGIGLLTIKSKADGISAFPGSIDDPVITKSYLDQYVAGKVKEEISKQSTGQNTTSPNPNPTTSSSIEVVQLQTGQTLQAGAGSELIVRTGKVLAVSSDENGIPDVTAGKDISAGAPVELNHLMIFPREGRGIKPDPKSKGTVFVMIRGDYTIINADGTKVTR